MRRERIILVMTGIITGLVSDIARLSLLGWLFILSFCSVLVFSSLHIIFLKRIAKHFGLFSRREKNIAWLNVLSYPLIFLFQFEVGDNYGSLYVYEYITGADKDPPFEGYTVYIAIIAATSYIVNFAVSYFKIKNRLRIATQ